MHSRRANPLCILLGCPILQQQRMMYTNSFAHQVTLMLNSAASYTRVWGDVRKTTEPTTSHWCFTLFPRNSHQVRRSLFRGTNAVHEMTSMFTVVELWTTCSLPLVLSLIGRVNAEYDYRNGRPRLNTFDWLMGLFRTKEHFPRNRMARGSINHNHQDFVCVTNKGA